MDMEGGMGGTILAPDGVASCADEPAEQTTDRKENAKESSQEKGSATVFEAYPPEFEHFWSIYPRRVEKRRAYKAFKARLKQGAAVDDIIQAAKNYADYVRREGTEERFIKHPATFLGPSLPYEDWIQPRAPDGPRIPKAFDTLRSWAQEGDKL